MNSRYFGFMAILISTQASAGDVSISIDPNGGNELSTYLGVDANEISVLLSNELEKAFNLIQPQEYVRALTDAQAFSNKGLGVDYASNITKFIFGFSGNFALSLGDEGLGERYSERPVIGAAPNVSVMAGLSGSFLSFDDFTLYANYFAQRGEVQEIQADLRNFGLHAQLKFFRPEGDGLDFLFQWGGFDITSGVEYSQLKTQLNNKLETTLPLGDAEKSIDANFIGDGVYDITTTAMTIPLEVSTNIRLLYILALFVGVGTDIQLGNGSMKIDLEGDLTSENPTGDEEINLGTAKVEVEQKADPSPGRLRFFGGLQVNIWVVKLLVQASMIPDQAFSAGVGLRVAW